MAEVRDVDRIFTIVDSLQAHGANLGLIAKPGQDPTKFLKAPLEYAMRGGIEEMLVLHGITYKTSSAETDAKFIHSFATKMLRDPTMYLTATLHPDVILQLNQNPDTSIETLHAKAVEYVKSKDCPKVLGKYTENAVKVFHTISAELSRMPDTLLHCAFSDDVSQFIEKYLDDQDFKLLKIQLYKMLKAGADPKHDIGYTTYATELLSMLSEEMQQDHSLYLSVHANSLAYMHNTSKFPLATIKAGAKKLLEEQGYDPHTSTTDMPLHTVNLLEDIASKMNNAPIKFLSMKLHKNSLDQIKTWLSERESSIKHIKDSISGSLKQGQHLDTANGLSQYAQDAINRLAQELMTSQSTIDSKLFLNIKLSSEVYDAVETRLHSRHSTTFDQIKENVYEYLKNGGNPKSSEEYTQFAQELLERFMQDMQKHPELFLYAKMHPNTIGYLKQHYADDLTAIYKSAKLLIESGLSPITNPDAILTANATYVLTQIAKEIQKNNMKFLYITLDEASSIPTISKFLQEAHTSSLANVIHGAIASLKQGANPKASNSDTLTDNARYIITTLGDQLLAEPQSWLYINTLHKETYTQLGSRLEQIKAGALNALKHGAEPQQHSGGVLPHATELLLALKKELESHPKNWIYINLSPSSIGQLEALGLNVENVKTAALASLEAGDTILTPNGIITSHAASIMEDLINGIKQTQDASHTKHYDISALEYIASQLGDAIYKSVLTEIQSYIATQQLVQESTLEANVGESAEATLKAPDTKLPAHSSLGIFGYLTSLIWPMSSSPKTPCESDDISIVSLAGVGDELETPS